MDPLARFVAYLFLVASMLGIGLKVSGAEIRATLQHRGLMLRTLLANFLLVPVLGVLLVWLVPMERDLKIGFLLLALAPGGLGAIQFTSKAKGALAYAAVVTFVLTVLSALISPLLAVAIVPGYVGLSVPYGRVIGLLFLALLLPLLVGVAAHHRLPKLAGALANPVALIGALEGRVVATLLLFIIGSMAIGWCLGGPEGDTRRVLASATSMRNAPLCLLIAMKSLPETHTIVLVVAFSALMVPPNLLFTIYSAIRARRAKKAR
jgi:BASS family bile acid:Na+ symporter